MRDAMTKGLLGGCRLRHSYKRSAARDAMPHAAMTPNTPWLLVRLTAPFEPPEAVALALDVLEPLGEVAEALAAEPEADALLDALEVGAGAPKTNETKARPSKWVRLTARGLDREGRAASKDLCDVRSVDELDLVAVSRDQGHVGAALYYGQDGTSESDRRSILTR